MITPDTLAKLAAIKRYDVESNDLYDMEERETGTWVLYDDHIAALTAQSPAAAEPTWVVVSTVADLVRNLRTLDQTLPIHAGMHADYKGRRVSLTCPISVSRERVKGRFIDPNFKEVPYSIIVWAGHQQDNPDQAAQQAAQAPQGWVLVPPEVTPAMSKAFAYELSGACASFFDWSEDGDAAYRAMLAARPQAEGA